MSELIVGDLGDVASEADSSAPGLSTCAPWIDSFGSGRCADVDFDPQVVEDAIDAATGILYQLSGRQFSGSCQETVRPVLCSCRCMPSCCCPTVSEVYLGGSPVTAIDEVLIDGELLVEGDDYRIDDHRTLVRLPDENGTRRSWPRRQRLDLASTEEDTFEVTFTYGVMPPPEGVAAAKSLACELALLWTPSASGECRLPARTQSVVRQGISVTLSDPQQFLDEGRTGLIDVDMFLKAHNPNQLRRRAAVFSPDVPRKVRRADTGSVAGS